MGVDQPLHDLILSIKESEEYQEYQRCLKKIKEDSATEQVVRDYKKDSSTYQILSLTQMEIPADLEERYFRLQEMVELDPVIIDYFEAERKLAMMIAHVYQALEREIPIFTGFEKEKKLN